MRGPDTGPFDLPTAQTATRSDLVMHLRALGLAHREAQRLVGAVVEELCAALVEEGELKLRGFGRFQVVRRAGHIGRVPRTGEAVEVPPHQAVTFHAAPALRAAMTEALRPADGEAS